MCHKARRSAGVAELVDAPDSKSGEGDLVSVRFRSSVFKEHFDAKCSFFLPFEGSGDPVQKVNTHLPSFIISLLPQTSPLAPSP